ncbi:Pyoverdin chromophore biosynthetic protein pvcC (plasmid) [Mycetohabitans rhizoxinica HKI 454]|uniref:Pyoverdin chromophore biosynthetic protein pvcC n=2 Tax=Mycetohabitans rhizoxinica TaxID=412963 RepID=E5AU61_MYCRK|nr:MULTISPECIES: 4-hydroxyphenylacetate 3-hydroxylase N-terminal domain-containing protein [Mycetohabitans]MCG1048549.1 Pyoverdin chromophore biosynthetic protein pvcC [Mycetohabitans sp. B6]CBW76635.1 Pyoverdin chromophore biosynthetic protein pvcC [Mycetohabitans rhizoxinica HKI 454]
MTQSTSAALKLKAAEKDEMLTADEYLASLDDGREVFIYGEKVRSVTQHVAFRNSARSIARLYDALHAPAFRDTMTTLDPAGYRTHRYFTPARSADDLLRARAAIAHWSRLSYGFMGRTPDYKAGFTATLLSDPDFYDPFRDNAIRWYHETARKVLFMNHVLVNPPVGRAKAIDSMRDVYLHVEKERDDGIVVRGAKMVATSAAISNATFVAQNSATQYQQGREEDFALCFILPMGTPNLKIVCRRSYEASSLSPFDNPLSSRFDENDSVLIFDGVFVPWENVLIYRDIPKARSFYSASGFLNRYPLQSGTRLAVKLDFLCGALIKLLESNGSYEFRGVRTKVADVVGWRNAMWAMTEAMCMAPQKRSDGSVVPRLEAATTVRHFGAQVMTHIKPIFDTILGGSLIMQVASFADMRNPELSGLIDTYFQGTDSSAQERLKLVKLLWDAIGSEFGGRHELYEYNYAGNHEQVRLDMLNHSTACGAIDQCKSLVEQCLADYDVDGWHDPSWQFDGQREVHPFA